jgi:hypothetical protein
VFVAAWRHIVGIFRKAGAGNATWMWTINSIDAAHGPVPPWWPGSQWVDWVGIDGYYFRPTDTFNRIFGTTISLVRGFTHAPILIAEMGIGPQAGQIQQIKGLFAGVQAEHLVGLVWFDVAQHNGIYHQDWRLEDTPTALTEFKHQVALLQKGLLGVRIER